MPAAPNALCKSRTPVSSMSVIREVLHLPCFYTQTARHPMVLLMGPPGCGKTTTLHALAREMGCAILEWVNPVSDVGGSDAGTCIIGLLKRHMQCNVYSNSSPTLHGVIIKASYDQLSFNNSTLTVLISSRYQQTLSLVT